MTDSKGQGPTQGPVEVNAIVMHPYHCPLDGEQLHEIQLGFLMCRKCKTQFLPTYNEQDKMFKISWGAVAENHSAECVDTLGYKAMDAAYSFIDSVIDRADSHLGTSPLWHGWALREAFIAGAEYQLGQMNDTA